MERKRKDSAPKSVLGVDVGALRELDCAELITLNKGNGEVISLLPQVPALPRADLWVLEPWGLARWALSGSAGWTQTL